MVGTTKRDVQLVVKARDEGTRVVDKYAESILTVIKNHGAAGKSAESFSGDLAGLVAALADVEKANNLVVGAADRADAAFKRQSSNLAETRAQLAAVKSQIENANRAIANGPKNIVDAMLGGGDVGRVRAEIAGAEASLKQLTATEGRLTQSIKTQETALGQQRSSLQEISSLASTTEGALQSLGTEAERSALKGKAAIEAETRALREQAAAAKEAAEQQRNNDKFSAFMGITPNPGGSVAGQSAGVFEEQMRLADAAQRLRDKIDPLAAIQAKFNRELAEAKVLLKGTKNEAADLAAAEALLATEADQARAALDRTNRSGKSPLLGLRSHEVTNLGYQVNDIVTQLASGTAPMQVLAQQGGQVLQIIPGIGRALLTALTNPAVLAGVTVIGGLAVVLSKASDEAERLRKVEGLLASISDGGKQSAEALSLTVGALQRIGLSSDEAFKQVSSFVTQGLNPNYLLTFSQAAADMAAITGKSIPEAAAEMREGLTQGYDAVVKLDEAYNFLTASERAQIRAMFDGGKAAEARATATRLFAESQRDGAKATNEAKGALESLTVAVDDFLGSLAKSSLVKEFTGRIRKEFQDLARDIRVLTTDNASLADLDGKIADVKSNIESIKAGKFLWLPGIENFAVKQASLLSVAQSKLRELEQQRAKLAKEAAKASGDPVNQESDAIKKRREETLADIELERQIATTTDEAYKIKLEGEKAYREEMRKTGDVVIANARKKAAIDAAEAAMRKKNGNSLRDSVGENLIATATKYSGMTEQRNGNQLESFFKANGVTLDPEKLAWCAAFLNSVLNANGLPGTGSNMARSFKTYGTATDKPQKGDIVVFKDLSGANDPNKGHVGLYMGPGANGKIKVLGGNQGKNGGGEVKVSQFSTKDVIAYRRASGAIQTQAQLEEKRLEDQEKFNEKIDDENEKRTLSNKYAAQQAKLSGDALLDALKQQAIDEAILKAEQDAAKKNIALDETRKKTIQDTVAAEWDLAHARERATVSVDNASGERQSLLDRIETARQMGDAVGVSALTVELEQVDKALASAIDKAIEFWKQFDTPEARTAINGLMNLKDGVKLSEQKLDRDKFEMPIGRLQDQRSGLQEQIQFYKDLGQNNVVETLRDQLRQTDAELLKGIEDGLAYWRAHDGPEAQAAILNLENMRNQVMAAQQEFAVTAGQIQQAFAGSLSDSVKMFAQELVDTGNPLRALGVAALNFAASFLEKIADMILQMAALKLAMKLGFGPQANQINGMLNVAPLLVAAPLLSKSGTELTAGGTTLLGAAGVWMATAAQIQAAAAALAASGGAGGGGGGSPLGFFAGLFHSGGIAGSATRGRMASPGWFASATRYHSGGLAGLKPDEVPAVLQRGEEILTKTDARHRLNGGMGGGKGAPKSKTEILAIGDKEIASAMASASGDEVMMRWLRRNKETARQILDE